MGFILQVKDSRVQKIEKPWSDTIFLFPQTDLQVWQNPIQAQNWVAEM